MRINRIVMYGIDGREFGSVKLARQHVENEAARILQSALNIHDGRHKNAIAAIESILENPQVRARLAALLSADLTLDEEEN